MCLVQNFNVGSKTYFKKVKRNDNLQSLFSSVKYTGTWTEVISDD